LPYGSSDKVLLIDPPTFKFPPNPRPPDTTSAPVDVDVETVVLAIPTAPPMLAVPPSPKPPDTTNAPVVVFVETVVLAIPIAPPMLTVPPIPIPPVITTAPVVELVDTVVFETLVIPAMLTAPPMPIPPVITTAPVVELVDTVVLEIVTFPEVAAILIPFPPELCRFNAPASFRNVALLTPPSEARVDPFSNNTHEDTPSFDKANTLYPDALVFYVNIEVGPAATELITVKSPKDVIVPPTFKFPPIPTPSETINAPVEVDVESINVGIMTDPSSPNLNGL